MSTDKTRGRIVIPVSALPWLVAIALAFAAGWLWARPPQGVISEAFAQTPQIVGARGVYAFTGQLDRNNYGLFMLDIEQGTIWCYEMDNVGGSRKLRLVAARTWIYDRYLRDFNCAPPDFRMVQQLVAQQRANLPDAASPGDADEPANSPLTDPNGGQ